MPFWYYFSVPQLPPEVAHQSNCVEIMRYVAVEGSVLDAGSPVAIVENYWAVMTLKANSKGILKKTFFDPGTSVKIGDPIAIVGADGESLPYGRESVLVEVTKRKRSKPRQVRRSPEGDT
jgi:pyruvate/2-oxoglutarate dehydrogenase complex dihydrolipoamide acyltransferase (E2) component